MQGTLVENLQLVKKRYRIVRLLSRGGEGYIYLAQDTLNNNQICVLKQLYHSLFELGDIQDDYGVFCDLYHPNIVQVLNYFVHQFFVAMNYVPGISMKDHLRRRNKPMEEMKALDWSQRLAGAIRFLHKRPTPIIHADIAPDNIMITPAGELVLIDFGIARLGQEATGIREHFSAPEQMDGTLNLSCDVYSLGATMFKMLTLENQPEPGYDPREINPSISPRTAELIMKATAPSRSALFGLIKKRIQDMDEMSSQIQAVLRYD
jgi:serine/threonine protein kinase